MAFLWILSCFAFVSAAYGCGTPAIQPVITDYSRLINGEEAVPHSWPWQVSIQDYSGFHFCGGSLINENWVVTAAHCNVRTSHLVILGEHDRSSSAEKIQVIKIAKVFTHPQYHEYTFYDDILLIKLASPAHMDKLVSPVCVAETGANYPSGMKCVTSGWGLTVSNAQQMPALLQQTTVPLLSNDECKRFWGIRLFERMICAGGAGTTSCMGDYGGPLVCEEAGVWTLVGVSSWGSTFCSLAKPSVFSRVTSFRAWMDETMVAN